MDNAFRVNEVNAFQHLAKEPPATLFFLPELIAVDQMPQRVLAILHLFRGRAQKKNSLRAWTQTGGHTRYVMPQGSDA